MLTTSAAQSSSCGPSLAAKASIRPARLSASPARPSGRHVLAPPPTAIDPATAAFVAYQTQQFGLALIGIGVVGALASGSQLVLQRETSEPAAAAATAAPPAAISAPATAKAPNADTLVANMIASSKVEPAAAATPTPAIAEAAPVATPVSTVAATLNLGDIKAELQSAAAAAVQAVKTAAEGSSPVAPARAAAARATPNGDAAKPGMTVQEATRQVQDWVAAWRSTDGEGEPSEAIQIGAIKDVPTTRITEPSLLSSSAAAVLGEMTADAPVGATSVGAAAVEPSNTIAEALGKLAAPQKVLSKPAEPGTAEQEAAYKEHIGKVVTDSKLAAASRTEAAAAAGNRLSGALSGYQAKIEGLWASYEQKKAKEAELLAKSDAILQNLAAAEAVEKAQQEAVAAASEQQQEQGLFALMLARLVALFQAVKQFVQQLVAKLTGSSDTAAGASA